jgi:histone-lysine N-methyltransferase SETMAR
MEKHDYRSYIKQRTNLGEQPIDIHQDLETLHGEDAPAYSTVAKWAKRFREGRMDIEDDPRSGCPVTSTTPENIELIESLIEADPHSTYDDLEAESQLSRGIIETIILEHLKMKKLASRWVPHNLTDAQKKLRVEICRENLRKFHSGSWRPYDIVTGDETWIYFRQTKRKASNACWIKEGEKPKTIVKQGQYAPKRLFSIFFKANGWLTVHALAKGQTIDYSYYIDKCLIPVVKELWRQRPNTGPKGLKLLHDNATPHVKPEVITYIKTEQLQLMRHPPYSPDLAPCDFWLNDYIKRHLSDQEDEESLFSAVTQVLENIPQEEYAKTFKKLLERMQWCIDNGGDYFEHLM